MSATGRERVSGAGVGVGVGAGAGAGADEGGQIMILILGYLLLALSLVVVAVDITALHLARTELTDSSDSAALDAADAIDRAALYRDGLREDVPLTDAAVRASAATYLGEHPAPRLVQGVRLDRATGSPDGASAVVELTGRVRLPLLGPVVRAWSGGVDITVRSRARADLDPP